MTIKPEMSFSDYTVATCPVQNPHNNWTEIVALIAGVTGLLLTGIVPSSFHLALVGFSGCLTFALLHSVCTTFFFQNQKNKPGASKSPVKHPYFKAAWTLTLAIACLFLSFFLALSVDETYQNERAYNRFMETFRQNEHRTLEFYDNLYQKDPQELSLFITNVSIPLWHENLQIAKKLKRFDNPPSSNRLEASLLHKYAELRLKAFEAILEEISTGWDKGSHEVIELHKNMEEIMVLFNEDE